VRSSRLRPGLAAVPPSSVGLGSAGATATATPAAPVAPPTSASVKAGPGSEAGASPRDFELRNPGSHIATFQEIEQLYLVPDRVKALIDASVMPLFETLTRNLRGSTDEIKKATANIYASVQSLNETMKATGLDQQIARLTTVADRFAMPVLFGGGEGTNEQSLTSTVLDSAGVGRLGSAGILGFSSLTAYGLSNLFTAGAGLLIGSVYLLTQIIGMPIDRSNRAVKNAIDDVEGFTPQLYSKATPAQQEYMRDSFEASLKSIKEEIEFWEEKAVAPTPPPHRGPPINWDKARLDARIEADNLKRAYDILERRYDQVSGRQNQNSQSGAPALTTSAVSVPSAPAHQSESV